MPAGTKATGPASYFPSIEKAYGRPVQAWLDLAVERLDDGNKHMEVVDYLKSEHALGGVISVLIAASLVDDTEGSRRLDVRHWTAPDGSSMRSAVHDHEPDQCQASQHEEHPCEAGVAVLVGQK